MNTAARIHSILNACSLDEAVTGMSSFKLSELQLEKDHEFSLPTNLRLGHLAEKTVSELIARSSTYNMLYENIQLVEDKTTIGEIDFILESTLAKKPSIKQIIHVELAYKFYLYDPNLSSEPLNNWIGPNRNDSLKEKLDKLKEKQLPLFYHNCAKERFNDIVIEEASQAICLLVSLYIPYKLEVNSIPNYKHAVKGFYLNLETFYQLDNPGRLYHLPTKNEWGIKPSENQVWEKVEMVESRIRKSVEEKQAPLCWVKDEGSPLIYSEIFIVWWEWGK
tara:strand:- start:494 stop:1327 length:834 start_codon:yes stop_codon:yes gene_type:complete